MESFEKLYQQLNTEQQQAVDALEGPVMVIAGPGTGKTQILAARILNILRQQDQQPQNILCLTYTEAGAMAMQKRLHRFMGSDAGKVNIHTFHGLCNKIIQENPDKFSKRELRIMDDLDKIEILQGIIERLPADSVLKTYQDDAQSTRKELTQLWEFMQLEGIDAEEIKRWVALSTPDESFKLLFPDLVYTRKYKEFQAGDIKPNEKKKLEDAWKKACEAADLHQTYRKIKKEKGLYEFSDMLEWVANEFDQNEDLLLDIQERYQYILVDEYQDTSGLQNRILMHLISYWGDRPNCFVVGDDDQSIYAFQGAKVSNMMRFSEIYAQQIQRVVLTQNYRSTQVILDTAKSLIDKNKLRLIHQVEGLSKELMASGDNRDYPSLQPSIQLFTNEFHESVGIAESIKQLLSSGIQAKDIAVIYALNKHATNITKSFEANEIPFVVHRAANILEDPIVQHLLNWLEYLGLELSIPNAGEHMIYRLLLSPIYQINTFEINQLSVDIYQRKRKSEDTESTYTWRQHISELIHKPQQGNLFERTLSDELTKLWNSIEHWLHEAAYRTVPQLISLIYGEGGYLEQALKSNEMEWTLEILETFLTFAQKQCAKNPQLTLSEFVSIVKQMQSNKLSIPVEKRIGMTEGVQLITAHSSKGLEYDHVFIIRANRDDWEKGDSGKIPYRLKPLVQAHRIKLENHASEEEEFEEKRRLFYVALTRAKKSVHISYNLIKITETKSSEQLPSVFVSECNALSSLPEKPTAIPVESLLYTKKQELAKTAKPKINPHRLDWIKHRIGNFTFSPSSLYAIHECGIKFYFNTLVRVPDVPGPATSYGTAVHNTLKEWLEQWQKNKKWMSESDVLEQFEWEMRKLRFAFNEKQFGIRKQQGIDNLPKYYKQRSEIFKLDSLTHFEKQLNAHIEGVKLSGRLDKIIFNGKQVTIVDYKTGKPENSRKKLVGPKGNMEKLPNSYWFQLGIYQLMINAQTEKQWNCQKAIIDCVDSNPDGDYPQLEVYYNQEDNELLLEWIRMGQAKLNALAFLDGCGKADCYWCNFAKSTPAALGKNTGIEESMVGESDEEDILGLEI